VEGLISFKRGIIEDPLLVFSTWNSVDSNPCNWTGVSCTADGDHVIKLNISSASLRGFVVSELHQLPQLQQLILHENLLIGTLPKEIGLLRNLQVLDLGSNQLTGTIPREIGNLTNIRKIDLQSNGFTGNLPYEFGDLKHLEDLRLSRNKFLGLIPGGVSRWLTFRIRYGLNESSSLMGLCGASQLHVLDLSYNFLVGSIPKCLANVPRSSFLGNCLHEKDLLQRSLAICAGEAQPLVVYPRSKHVKVSGDRNIVSKPTWLLALEILTGIIAGSVFIVAVFTAFQKWRAAAPPSLMPWMIKSGSFREYNKNNYFINPSFLKDVARYSRKELEVACEDFSNIIGSSSPDCLVYKGTLSPGHEIAVSSLSISEDNWTGYTELCFQEEVADLARLNHENVGKLLGYCRESLPFTRMLVFDYASNGTLYEHLHDGDGCQLSWSRRMKIVIGIAKGLEYLHTEAVPPFTLPQLDSSCIYLTENFSPKLVDFNGWKRILTRSRRRSTTNPGAKCIIPPGSLERWSTDLHANMHAFGVILLEIISGRTPHCKEKGHIVDWAKEFLDSDVLTYMVDPNLKHFRYEDLKVVCRVAKICISSPSSTSMPTLCDLLENGVDTSMSVDMKAAMAWAELQL
ncbi:hypothetical protein M569_05651, partial [Genlisea aurea]